MCGKFTQLASWRELVEFSRPLTDDADIITATPMCMAYILRLDESGKREMAQMRWGFSDRRAQNPSRPKHMHARAETIDTLPTFAESFAKRRGILIVRNFNIGEELPNGKTKQWVITPKDRMPLAFAVIYEDWEDGDQRLSTFVQVTVPANPLIARITDRMPALLAEKDWPLWLGEHDAHLAEVKDVLRTVDDAGGWEMEEQVKPSKRNVAQPDLF